jgi:hypothetical protein
VIPMVHDELGLFLINMKLIYQHGVSHSKNKSKMQRLFAIHNSHYVVEQIVREQAKDITFKNALHKIGFDAILKKVHKKKNIPDYNRLLDLNRIRNGAEHSNIIPDVDDVRFYVRIVGDFLKWSYKQWFGVDYESLAFEDMIYDVPIKNVMIIANESIQKDDLQTASKKMYEALGAFKFMWFKYLSDTRLIGESFKGLSFTNLIADLGFKIILSEDEVTLRKLMTIGTEFTTKNGKATGVQSVYPEPLFKNKEHAKEHYNEILNILLTYQDRIPASIWRTG